MADDGRWRIVNDFNGNQLVNVLTICPSCWVTHGHDYPVVSRSRSNKTTTVRTCDACRLSPDGDECYLCAAKPQKATA